MSTPSLLNIPYLYKAGTLYSQIPESGAGDFTVQRTTTVANRSTRINKDGFIETVLDNVPRLDYPLGGAVNGCPALLLEPSAINSFIESQTLFTTHFVQGLTLTGYTNAATSPDGSVTAEKFVPDTANGVHGIANGSLLAITSGTTYTFSLFVKSDGGPYNLIALQFDSATAWGATRNCIFNASNGTNFSVPAGATMTSENYGNGWYRLRATLTAVGSVAAAQYQYRIYVTNPSGSLSWAAPSGNTNGIFCWGAQLETGSVATSYIPTTTAAITRSAELISRTGATALIGQTEGTLYMEMQANAAGTGTAILTLGGSSSDNFLYIGKDSGVMRARLRIAATDVINNGATALTGSLLKVAVAYQQSGNCAAYVNGNFLVSGTAVNNFGAALTGLGFGEQVTLPITSISAIMRIRGWATYPNRIPNTAAPGVLSLATLTAL